MKHAYNATSLVRGLLLVVETYMPTCCDTLKMSTLLQYLPDEVKHCKPLSELLGLEIREQFQVSPSLVSCWSCCVAFTLGDDKLRLAPDLPSKTKTSLC